MAEAKKESGKSYFVCKKYSGLTIKKEDGSKVRFTAYWDTFKGDQVRVGYLVTDDSEVVKRCESLDEVEKLTKDQYEKSIKGLSTAAQYAVA